MIEILKKIKWSMLSQRDFRSGSKFFHSLAYNSIKGMENVSSEGANKTPGVDINVGKSAAAEDGSQAKSCPLLRMFLI